MNATDLGIVVIGRNEGERLARCLRSLNGAAASIVYVDSGSTDQSVSMARQAGAEVVELDRNEPFTAAKARNAGLKRLLEFLPNARFVQFVDGDCEVDAGWMEEARQELLRRDETAVVCGRRRERFPEASIYNRLCDMEWDTPVGEARACGGDAMMRVAALKEVGGYRPSMIAGEEPELCARLRAKGWSIVRIGAEMTLHDAAITRFGQWWRRSVRAGHAFAEMAWLHGGRHALRRTASIVFWAALLPLMAIALAWTTRGISLAVLPLLYLLLALRVYLSQRRRGRAARDARLYATFVMIGKFAELSGMLRFAFHKLLRRRGPIIEYKSPPASPASQTP